MADKWPLANGNWSNAANWNGGTKPVAGDDVYADGRTLNVDEGFTVATLRNTQRSGGTLGGTFNFNTASVVGNITGLTPIFVGATNTITHTINSGLVTITVSSSVTNSLSSSNMFNITGNGNILINGLTFTAGFNGAVIFNKSGSGDLTINANLVGGTGNGNPSNSYALNISSGNAYINGNISSAANSTNTNLHSINATGNCNVYIIGNVVGNSSGGTNGLGIVFTSSGLLSITGNVTGGSSSVAISSSAPVNNITGNVTAGTVAAITSSSANIINVTGTVTASATSQAISMTNANGQVYLNGNMVNNNGKMAIYAPIVWLDTNNTTSAAFFTSGGVARTLYSEDTVPNTPAANNVRSGTTYGAGNSLVGTVVMPTAANVRNGVVYDNGTTGTALFTTSQLLTEISGSSDAVAVRIKNCATPQILGEILEAYKK
jgi:hypothetical protein